MGDKEQRWLSEHVPALTESPRVERFEQRIAESPADRAAQALMDATADFAIAILNAKRAEERLMLGKALSDAQTELLKSQATLETLNVYPR